VSEIIPISAEKLALVQARVQFAYSFLNGYRNERERYFSTAVVGRNRRFKRSRLKTIPVSLARARARKRDGDNYLSERIIKNVARPCGAARLF